ncbi:MAG: nuclear transport factor 2 family protein [Actinobacteria bacterium]|nr:nuclear transport factor 2 family protein [Actinomycetota bacterium]
MSRENVEIVRRCVEAWQRRDFGEALSAYDEAVVFEADLPQGGGVYEGHSGVNRWFAEWIGAFTDFWMEPQGYLDKDNCVVMLAREGGRGKGSGVPVARESALVYWLRQGKIVRVRGYLDPTEALEAAGLSE